MPEEVTVREDLQIIEVISYGEISARDFETTLSLIVRLQEERGLNKVLLMEQP